jgi:hypothetical protein
MKITKDMCHGQSWCNSIRIATSNGGPCILKATLMGLLRLEKRLKKLSCIARQHLRGVITRWKISDRCISNEGFWTLVITTSSLGTVQFVRGVPRLLSVLIAKVTMRRRWALLMWAALIIVGRYPLDTRTIQQRDALRRLLCLLHALYPEATLHGHREFAKKACPSFDVHADYGEIFGEEKVIVKS